MASEQASSGVWALDRELAWDAVWASHMELAEGEELEEEDRLGSPAGWALGRVLASHTGLAWGKALALGKV